MDEDETKHPPHGHITSLSVLRTHRKRGIATLLMKRSQTEMASVFGAHYVSLHVRKSNRAAFHLYNETLKYYHGRPCSHLFHTWSLASGFLTLLIRLLQVATV